MIFPDACNIMNPNRSSPDKDAGCSQKRKTASAVRAQAVLSNIRKGAVYAEREDRPSGRIGSIAAYKTAYLASALKKLQADVHVLMTQNAVNFINPITFETLTGNKCLVDTFDRNFEFSVEHVSLAKQARRCDDRSGERRCDRQDRPRYRGRHADDDGDGLQMQEDHRAGHEHQYVRESHCPGQSGEGCAATGTGSSAGGGISGVRGYGRGKDAGAGASAEYILQETACEKDMAGLKILVTAGPTQEAIDPCGISRTTHRKDGICHREMAARRGADVTLVSGETALEKPVFVQTVPVKSAGEMFDAVTQRAPEQDIIIKAAAVADYRPKAVSSQKVKKAEGELVLELERTQDILAYLGGHRQPGQILCGYAMENGGSAGECPEEA